jgi:molecular chaperone IbpA
MTNHQLVRFDTNALSQLNRALIGFDDIFNNFETRFANQINNTYPPYNILKHDEDTYEIEIAVTGFEKDEITVEIDQNNLVVKGARKEVDITEPVYLHRGLASRDFTRSWELGQHIEVSEGTIKNGVLTIGLKRVVPESLKPRVLKLKAG